jgi:hypothetical protein
MTTIELVKYALESCGVNCGYKAANTYSVKTYGKSLPESSYYKMRKSLIDTNGLAGSAYTKPVSKFSPKAAVFTKPKVATFPKPTSEITPPRVATSQPNSTQNVTVEEVTFAEMLTVAAVVKRIGADRAMKAIQCIHDLQTVLVKS